MLDKNRTVQLPHRPYVSVCRVTDAEFTVRNVPHGIALELGGDSYISQSSENWALIIPAIVELLPANLRDDVANAICAAAGEVAS